jgi:exopolysaccharide biosynthesis polyprenyl glycosylphosphotransferase
VDFLVRHDTMVSRGWLALSWVLALGLVWMERFFFRRIVYTLRERGHLLSPALIVGANQEGVALLEQLEHWSTSGLYILGFIDEIMPVGSKVTETAGVLGKLDDLERIVKEQHIQDVIVAQTALEKAELLTVFQSVTRFEGVNLRLSSGLFEIVSTGLRVKELASVPLVEVAKTRISGLDAFIKSVMDNTLSSAILLAFSPLLLLIAVLIKIDSLGPVLHRRRVMGVNGTQFDAFKFRTMQVNGDYLLKGRPDLQAELEQNYKLKIDPRVTRLGRVLRKFSLDELPQLVNVLRGQMSLVGPRMISPPEMEKYGKWGLNLLTVKPGLTGLWQVSGRSDVDYSERIQLDMQYIRNWTIWQDVYIIGVTLPAILKNKGAY